MNNLKSICTVIMVLAFLSFKSDKPAYQLYAKNGKAVTYGKMINKLKEADVVLIGEYHNNPISHWLELEITKSLYNEKEGNITMGAEMFEADNQMILDEYLEGIISRSKFEAECRLWSNYDTDYAPLVEFAKDSAINFVASNIPRRYASVVHKSGMDALDKLSSDALKYIAPLPIPLDPDSVLAKKMGGMMGKDPLPIAKAQAIKDATMGYFICKNYEEGKVFIHYNGSFHSDDEGGIRKYLQEYKPGLKVLTISTVEQNDISKLNDSYINKADFMICVTKNMTKTYVGMRTK